MGAKRNSDQLEEGEIVDDDDDFEDISDNSISDLAFGKLVSPNGHLRALSLSSGSDCVRNRSLKHKRKLLHHKCKLKQHRRRKRTRPSSDTSDSDISPPIELKGKLKEAVHISDVEGAHKNTLEARLKAMGGLTVGVEPTALPEPPPETSSKKEVNGSVDKLDDTELENLRLEALKTAVLNKHQRRKRKKALEGQEAEKPKETQENKENDTPTVELNDKNNREKTVTNNAVDDLDEDEDLLRASLLAGLAKNITKKQTPSENPLQVKQVAPKPPAPVAVLPKQPLNKFKSSTVNKKIVNKRVINKQVVNNKVIKKVNLPKPQVKPLIINVDTDSDSEEETKRKAPNPVPQMIKPAAPTIPKSIPQKPNLVPLKVAKTSPKIPDLSAITTNVEKFLKEQREKFETENKSKLQMKTISKNKTVLEKSAVKLLPKSQQIEYQLLLKKLRNAEKNNKAKKLALQNLKTQTVVEKATPKLLTVEVHQEEANVEVAATTDLADSPKVEVVVQAVVEKNSDEQEEKADDFIGSHANSSRDSETSERRGITSELTILQKALKEMKMQKNGSLQIKSKYQTLTPIIKKITVTSNDRKKQEHRIKALLQELSEARNSLTKSHERFSNLVKELVSKKEKIDKSCQESKVENGKRKEDKHKLHVNKRETKALPITSTPIKSHCEVPDEATISTIVTSSTNNDYEDMDVCNSDETDIGQIDIVDPNDIDQIFRRRLPVKSAIPEYVSPLNFNQYERYTKVDPLGIMCPYEVNGSCRDVDCTYKHYLKSDERL